MLERDGARLEVRWDQLLRGAFSLGSATTNEARVQARIDVGNGQPRADAQDATCPLLHQADGMGDHVGTKEDGIAYVELEVGARRDKRAADATLDEDIQADVGKAVGEGRIGVGRDVAAGRIDQPPRVEANRVTEEGPQLAHCLDDDWVDDADEICFCVSGSLSAVLEVQWRRCAGSSEATALVGRKEAPYEP